MNRVYKKKYHFIYITTNIVNNKQYVGYRSTNNLEDGYIGSGKPLFENAVKKYGKDKFIREILDFCNLENWREKEIFWIKEKNTHYSFGGYNLTWGGDGGNLGEDVIKRAAASRKGYHHSTETKLKISESEKGKIVSKETRIKMSASHKGLKPSIDTIEKWVETRRKNGYTHSKETRRKISIANKGKALGNNLKNRPKKKCPHCKRDIDISNYARYHGEKCKFKE